MADSDITVSGLTATAGLGHVALSWLYSDPHASGGHWYVRLAAVEVWASASNDRSTASKIGEGFTSFVHTGLTSGATRYYWIEARNGSGLYGDWHPSGSTSGVSATAGYVTVSYLSVSTLSGITANLGSITAGSIDGVSITGTTFTGGTFQTASSGRRIAITGADNYVSAYDSGGALVGQFGQTNASGTVLYATGGGLSSTAFLTNNSAGPALALSHSGSGNALSAGGTGSLFETALISASNTAAAAIALRAKNVGASGGSGLVGVSSGGGGWAFYAETGAYGPFTGAHDGLLPKTVVAKPGDIVCDVRVVARNGVSDALTEIALSTSPRQRVAVGVFVRRCPFKELSEFAAFLDTEMAGLHVDLTTQLAAHREEKLRASLIEDYPVSLDDIDRVVAAAAEPLRNMVRDSYHAIFLNCDGVPPTELAETHDRVVLNSLGEGSINVCGENGPIEAGDLIVTSSIPGNGMRQDDDLVRSCTVARAREGANVRHSGDRAQIACIYLCG